jgi:hypothetical protein
MAFSFLSCRSPASVWSFRDGLEGDEGMGPEPVEIGAQRFEARGVHRVNATSSFRAVGDKTGALEHPQVLGDGWPADREVAGQLAHCPRAFGETLEDRTPSVVAQGVPWSHFVSNH